MTAIPAFSDHRHHVEEMMSAALASAEPGAAVERHMARTGNLLHVGSRSYPLDTGRVFLVAVGKASLAMAAAASRILGDDLGAGMAISSGVADQMSPPSCLPATIRVLWSTHPISDEKSIRAAEAVQVLLAETEPGDLVLCLFSGGASALMTSPRVELSAWQSINDALITSGCSIDELNAVRKRLDRIKGGGLARLALPATCASLILSDVIGNRLDVIGSGPTVENTDDAGKAGRVLARYGIRSRLRQEDWTSVQDVLREQDTEGNSPFPAVENVIVGDVRQAAEAAVSQANQLGFAARMLTTRLSGEAREVGKVAAAIVCDARPLNCLVMGGETTVTLLGSGLGGRNQELALAAALKMDGCAGAVVVSLATDGVDGPTDAAGALVTGETAEKGRSLGLDPRVFLDRNDSYHFHEQVGTLLKSGPTGTNVNDLVFMLRYNG